MLNVSDKLGVVTTALFQQRDFRETGILDDFGRSLEISLRGKLTESGLYMGMWLILDCDTVQTKHDITGTSLSVSLPVLGE